MNTLKRSVVPIVLFIVLLVVPSCRMGPGRDLEPEHPHLICTRDQFPELRERAEREPWATMQEKALERVDRGAPSFEPDSSHRHAGKINQLHMYLGACALAYILQPDRRAAHANRVYRAIRDELSTVEFQEQHKHNGVVNPMGAAFSAIIALDVVYDDLADRQVRKAESVIRTQIEKVEPVGAWPLGRRGTHGAWDVYRGKRNFEDDYYHHHYKKQMTEDGVTTVATSYAWARLSSGDSRPQKTGYADVLEFTGADNRYYSSDQLKKFYRWLYGHSVTPARNVHPFGDYIFRTGVRNSTLSWRVGRFDRTAARYHAWAMQDQEPPGHVLSFVLKKKTYEPKVPTSTLYPDGGAFFREPEDDPDSLAAAMLNIRGGAQYHMNQETNSIALSAYGTRLLANGGWLGPPTRPAPLQNTVSVNGEPHEMRSGKGLRDGLTGPGLDYASGNSGGALPGKSLFKRNLVLVHEQERVPGYFLTVDEVQAPADATVYQYLQPSTGSKPEVRAKHVRYDTGVELFNRPNDTRMTVYYGSSPEQVERDLVPTGSERSSDADHYRLTARYPTTKRGRARLITVLFPYEKGMESPAFSSRADQRLNAVEITHTDGVTDHVYSTVGKTVRTPQKHLSFEGKLALFRRADGTVPFYLLRRGKQFRAGQVGFTAEHSVSLYMNGTRGRISTLMKTPVTFRAPGIRAVEYDGSALPVRERGDGSVTVEVPEGQNQPIRLLTR